MNQKEFEKAEAYMLANMQKTVHDPAHIYRVLFMALRIAKTEPQADRDVVVLASLLHDIGRAEEEKYPDQKHAEIGAEMAGAFLREQGYPARKVEHVQRCIRTHSHKGGLPPASIEAKILFDADKLDLCGAVGVARSLLFGAQIDEPLYLVNAAGYPTKGRAEEAPSFFREYHRKLRHMQDNMFTAEGKRLAKKRQKTMDTYAEELMKEINGSYRKGKTILKDWIAD